MRLALISVVGAVLFSWPFWGGTPPAYVPTLTLTVAALAALFVLERGSRQLDSARLSLLVVIAAVDSGLRLAVVTGLGGFSPTFFLILCAGAVFGADFGFLAGALSLAVSALVTGGVGPWLAYQMFAAGWLGAAAALARGRPLWVLALVGVVGGFAFGALMDVWDWTAFYQGVGGFGWIPSLGPPAALRRFGEFYLATSLAYDSLRAAGNAVMVLALGPPVLAAMRRLQDRMSFVVEPSVDQ